MIHLPDGLLVVKTKRNGGLWSVSCSLETPRRESNTTRTHPPQCNRGSHHGNRDKWLWERTETGGGGKLDLVRPGDETNGKSRKKMRGR